MLSPVINDEPGSVQVPEPVLDQTAIAEPANTPASATPNAINCRQAAPSNRVLHGDRSHPARHRASMHLPLLITSCYQVCTPAYRHADPALPANPDNRPDEVTESAVSGIPRSSPL